MEGDIGRNSSYIERGGHDVKVEGALKFKRKGGRIWSYIAFNNSLYNPEKGPRNPYITNGSRVRIARKIR